MPKAVIREFNRASLDGLLAEGHPVVTKSDDYTVLREESGTRFMIATTSKTFTLPATVKGLIFKFINSGGATNNNITLSPNSADAIHGGGMTSVDNKDLINTKGTSAEGDFVTLIGDGDAGWWIIDIQGTWAKQA